MGIAFEATVVLHFLVENLLTIVPKRRMPQIMRERREVYEVLVNWIVFQLSRIEVQRNTCRDLRDFNGVSQPISKKVALVERKKLCLSLQPSKSRRVDQSRQVPAKRTTIIPVLLWNLHAPECNHYFRTGVL